MIPRSGSWFCVRSVSFCRWLHLLSVRPQQEQAQGEHAVVLLTVRHQHHSAGTGHGVTVLQSKWISSRTHREQVRIDHCGSCQQDVSLVVVNANERKDKILVCFLSCLGEAVLSNRKCTINSRKFSNARNSSFTQGDNFYGHQRTEPNLLL